MIIPVIAAIAAAGAVWSLFGKPNRFLLPKYPPGSPEQIELFTAAAEYAGLPASWATHKALYKILAAESGGVVGRPNFLWIPWMAKRGLADVPNSWPTVWAEIRGGRAKPSLTGITSHAAGLGQLQPASMAKFQPDGILGVGDAFNEAVGMLKYIADRYGSMDKAWSFWQSHNFY
jgi:hypothetical protein